MNIKDLTQQLASTEALRTIAESFTEIGSIQLNKIRKQVEEGRAFFNDLSNIYGLIRFFTKIKNPSLKATGNGKIMAILLTSNFRHYGKISGLTTKFFIQFTKATACDQTVIGKLGADSLKAGGYNQKYNSLIFKNDLPDDDELRGLVNLIKDYSQVLVIYSEFKSVMTQLPVIKDITQVQTKAINETEVKNFTYTFILEPEGAKMIQFFDSQIKNVLLSGTFLEAELARVASRLMSMDQAQQNAKDLMKKEKQKLQFAKRSLSNKKMLETWVSAKAASL